MKKRLLVVLPICLLLVGAGFLPLFLQEDAYAENEALADGSATVDGIVFDVGGLSVGAGSAILIDADSGNVLYSKNADERRGMASTTKIMTALVILETMQTDTAVEITAEMTGVEGSSLYLKEGETLTVLELLYGLMLESGNDAAVALAIACDGSTEAFADRMNEKAQSMGLTDTHFVNPHGLSAEGHYTTARELAVITMAALQDPLFCEIVSTYQKRIPYDNQPDARSLTNHNPMLNSYDGMIGVKTGWTTADGKCFVTAAQRDGMTLIAVSLGDTGISATHTAMLDFGFAHYETVTVSFDRSVEVPLVGGHREFLTVKAMDTLSVCLPTDAEVTARVETVPFVYAGTSLHTAVGRVVFSWNGYDIGSVPLVTAEDAPVKRISLFEKWFG